MAQLAAPQLDPRSEEQLAAQAIGRVSGGWTTELIDARLKELQELRLLVIAGNLIPACPELTNANPSSPHTALLEAQAWLAGQQLYYFNQVPEANRIEFARLFGIEPKPATKATTTLRFTVQPPVNTAVTIPLGTLVSTGDDAIVFATDVVLVIPFGDATGTVAATRTVTGNLALAANQLTTLEDPIAYVTAVTNLAAIDSGTEAETTESALERMRVLQRRTQRIVSAADLEAAILDEALDGNGVVIAFEFVRSGLFDEARQAGYTTVVVMTRSGLAVSDEVLVKISELLDQVVGNQFVSVIGPTYVTFDIAATVRLQAGVTQSSALASAETRLRDFYAPGRSNFGRDVLRSEIIAVIEGTPGVDRIVSDPQGAILLEPLTDTRVDAWKMPKLEEVTLLAV